jgi:hypothetical protein
VSWTREQKQKKRDAERSKQEWIDQKRAFIEGLRAAKSALQAHPAASEHLDAEILRYEGALDGQLRRMRDLNI